MAPSDEWVRICWGDDQRRVRAEFESWLAASAIHRYRLGDENVRVDVICGRDDRTSAIVYSIRADALRRLGVEPPPTD
jgi:hypothetical protein